MAEKMIVETKNGKIRGSKVKNGIMVFKGIPYAKPPIKELRFKPPVPIESWNGVKDGLNFGPQPPQPPPIMPNPLLDSLEEKEDNCLSLNIYTPALDDKKRPVMFYVHGGSLEMGNGALYPGQFLSKRGDIVVVTINYRLGALGFLYVPGKTANVGLLDQALALRWVNDNINFFGGNSENITAFGESAGALSVSCLMTMPAARDLFKRGIFESNVATLFGHKPKEGEKFNKKIFSTVGVEYGDLDAMRKIPAKDLVDAFNKLQSEFTFAEYYPPYIDGNVLPMHPYEAIRKGIAKNFEILAGTNEDEFKLFSLMNPDANKMDKKLLYKSFKETLTKLGQNDSKIQKFIGLYEKIGNEKSSTSPLAILEEFQTDYIFRIPLIRYMEEQSAHQQNLYVYMFNWKSPAMGGVLGACHALEIPFVWNSLLDVEMGFFPKRTEETDKLSSLMMDCWINFARTGNPNHDGIPNWPKYEKNLRSTLIFGKEITVVNDPKRDSREIWGTIPYKN
ncbi:MAG: carboxylesterase/lipase family protein [Promethearchaeota archaeon]